RFVLKKNSSFKFNYVSIDFKVDDVHGKRVSWFSSAVDSTIAYDDFNEFGEISFHFKKFPLIHEDYILSYVLITDNIVQENAQEYLRFEVAAGAYYKSPVEITPNHTSVLLDYTVDSNFKR